MFSTLPNLATLLILGSTLSSVNAQQSLVGTWSSKSNAVFTGPDFYDPVNEIMHEPRLTGQSISFTTDGFFEQAIYAAIPNPQDPSCPKAMLQFQHGTYTTPDNGSIVLTPFAVDGRQLWSDPCANQNNAVYTRFNQSELYKGYEIHVDTYRKQWRLDLFKFDGSPVPPMYLAYNPPQMLPTVTLNPIVTATPSGKSKRSLDSEPVYNKKRSVTQTAIEGANLDRWWYIGVGVTILGGIGYFAV